MKGQMTQVDETKTLAVTKDVNEIQVHLLQRIPKNHKRELKYVLRYSNNLFQPEYY